MIESKEDDEDKELSKDSELNDKKLKKSKRKKGRERSDDKDAEDDLGESKFSDDEDEDDRKATFFTRPRRRSRTSSDAESDQDGDRRLLGQLEIDNQKETDESKGLTEAEAKEATLAIADGLSRELRNEFEQSSESSISELQAVATAAFIDSLREKIEAGDRDITEELLDEALREALEDLLGVDESKSEVPTGGGQGGGTNGNNGSSNNGNSGGPVHSNLPGGGQVSSQAAAFIAANANGNSTLASNNNTRGKGLLIGGVVGYIIGRRHGRKRAESKLQPEIDQLENQIAELYDALASREFMIRQVVQELAARQLGKQQTAKLATMHVDAVSASNSERPNASKEINPPSLIIPAAFATLLVSNRLMADVSDERYTWGKDLLVGGAAGYMIGRRHGRKRTETRIKSEMEELEDQVNNLQENLFNKDVVISAMVQVSAEADREVTDRSDGTAPEQSVLQGMSSRASIGTRGETSNAPYQVRPGKAEKQLVDASIDRIADSRKNRELNKHKKHLLETGKANAVGEFNLTSSVFLERRLMDGTENSSARKQIEIMDEGELLAMSQNIYVDGESAIDLYDKGRVELEVLRESVQQFWRKTGDYEQTLRVNLKADESAINDIRTSLERAYRAILDGV